MVRAASVVTVVMVLAACGGADKKEETLPDEGGGDEVVDEGAGDTGTDGMVPPERMDEIQRTLDRKRAVATRCLTDAIEAGDAPKNARGRVTLGFVISPAGKARDIEVLETSIESKQVQDCLVDLVGTIDFGELPRDVNWSYTYAFEAF